MTQLFSQDSVAYMKNEFDILEKGDFSGNIAEYSEEDVFVLPASFSQQRLWFLEQWEPGVYNIPIAVGLLGQLNREALDWSLEEIIRRHEVLRTTFKMVDNVLMQVVAPRAPFSVTVVDLLPFSRDVQKVKTRRLAKEDFQRPFDLSHGPLFRATLIKLSRHEHVLLLAMHHIISDGWSVEVLFRELQALYTAYVTGQPSPLPPLPIQYADYAIWQREWLQGEVLEKQLAYWKQQLGAIPVLQLPFDHPRPAIQTFRGVVQTFILPHALTAALKALSQRAGTTLFMTLMGAFQTLLFRYTEQTDITVGIPVAGRTESNLEDLIGCFINTLVLRTNFSGDPTFLELLTRVRDVALGAYDHQDIPFEKLVEELQPDRDLSHNPLTQVMFALQNVPHGHIQVPGLTLLPLHDTENAMLADVGTSDIHKKQYQAPDSKTAMFDIDLTMWERDDEIIGELKYNIDLFDASTIDRLQEHFLLLLDAIIADPTRRVNDLPILSEEEWQQQIVEWNAT
ncbi:MAG: condensation domain-containing protein, partial [Ktedonobacteraceae bacterium]